MLVDKAPAFLADPAPDFFPDEVAFFDLPDPEPVDPDLVFADADDELFFAEAAELFLVDDEDELFLADDELFFADPPEVELPFAEEVFPVDLVAAMLNILPARKFK
ncbi:MAG: hypothetical protein ABI539_02025 [Acidobacteriota bacterium]